MNNIYNVYHGSCLYTVRYITTNVGSQQGPTHSHTNSAHLGAGVAVYGAEVQSSCVYSLHQGLASKGTDTCGKQKGETEIDIESVRLNVCLCTCAPLVHLPVVAPTFGLSDFTKLSFRAHSCLAEAHSHTTPHTAN